MFPALTKCNHSEVSTDSVPEDSTEQLDQKCQGANVKKNRTLRTGTQENNTLEICKGLKDMTSDVYWPQELSQLLHMAKSPNI